MCVLVKAVDGAGLDEVLDGAGSDGSESALYSKSSGLMSKVANSSLSTLML